MSVAGLKEYLGGLPEWPPQPTVVGLRSHCLMQEVNWWQDRWSSFSCKCWPKLLVISLLQKIYPILKNELSLPSCALRCQLAFVFSSPGFGQFTGLIFVVVYASFVCSTEQCPARTWYSTKVSSVVERRDYRKRVIFAGVLVIPLNIEPILLITTATNMQRSVPFLLIFYYCRAWKLLKRYFHTALYLYIFVYLSFIFFLKHNSFFFYRNKLCFLSGKSKRRYE